MKMKVQFYVEPGIAKDALAVFPDERRRVCIPGEKPNILLACYSHAGQHSTCSAEYLKELRPATPAEYARLLAELKSIGYFPEVVGEKPAARSVKRRTA